MVNCDNWYFSENGQQHGPVNFSELQQLVRADRLPADALVWTKGMEGWKAVAEIPELAVPGSATPPSNAEASKWYYSDGEKRNGPVDQETMKRYLQNGQASAEALVWCKGMPEWVKASDIPELQSGLARPKPGKVEEVNTTPPGPQQAGSVATWRQSASALAADAKAASRLAVMEAERTKIVQVSLPSTYYTLGKQVYDSSQFRSDLADSYLVVDQLHSQLQSLDANSPDEKASTFSDKAKRLARQTQDAATRKMLQGKLAVGLRNLGKAAYERFGKQAGTPETIEGVERLLTRLEQLDENVAAIGKSGRLLSPKKLLIGIAGAVSLILLMLVASLFPGGGDTEQGNQFRNMDAAFKSDIAKADETWDAGEQAAAVELYRKAIHGTIPLRPMYPDMARGLERMIQFKMARGGLGQAAGDIEFAAKSNIPLSLSDPDANRLYAQTRTQHQQRTDQFLAEGRQRLAERKTENSNSEAGEADVTRLLSVRPGMSESEVSSILGRPHEVERTDVPAIPQAGKPARTFTSWTYNPGQDNFMVFVFENGRLIGGGSDGYDVESGLKVPQNLQEILNK